MRDRVSPAPSALRRAKLDNLALVPGSLLPFKEHWQELANQLPEGTTLIIVPSAEGSAKKTLEKVSSSMKAQGRRVAILPLSQVGL